MFIDIKKSILRKTYSIVFSPKSNNPIQDYAYLLYPATGTLIYHYRTHLFVTPKGHTGQNHYVDQALIISFLGFLQVDLRRKVFVFQKNR